MSRLLPIVAFDLSLTRTGWCNGSEVGIFIPPKSADRGMPRLRWIREKVLEKIGAAALVVIEGYSYGSKGAAVVSLGELGGVIRLALYETGIPYVEIAPGARAKFATGKGNAAKEAVLVAAVKHLGYEGHDNNEADALVLHRMAECWYDVRPATNAHQRAALASVNWPAITLAVPEARTA